MDKLDDTIVAIATAYGEGSIGIIRISGPETIDIIRHIFITPKGNRLTEIESHKLYYGYIIEPKSGKRVDEVMVALMKAPNSYTREDVAEIYCHGGLAVLRIVLQLILKSGARLAERGEFTRKAFLNGRLDLVQAEAVNEIIRAKNDAALEVALGQVEGALSREIREIRERMMGLLTHIEAALDFADEGIYLSGEAAVVSDIKEALSRIMVLIESYNKNRIIREGINLVIVGKPNVGKSSLMNCLLGEQRAIVTPIPGTTRDVLAEEIEVGGVVFRIKDTAGISKDSRDLVETEGIRRTKEELGRADIVLLVLDGSQVKDCQDDQVMSMIENKEAIAIINKIDLPQGLKEADLMPFFVPEKIMRASAKEGYGIEELRKRITELIKSLRMNPWERSILIKLRQKESLEKARDSLERAKDSVLGRLPEEVWSVDLKEAIDSLSEFLGETYDVDVLDRIFSEFCIGK